MKRWTLLSAAAMGTLLMAGAPVQADHTSRPEILRAIKTNAEAVKRDAAIYQRRRVASNVAHIVEDARKLQKALEKDSCLKEDAQAILKAVASLRSVSQENDPARTSEAVQKVADLTGQVYTKSCEKLTKNHTHQH